MTKPKLTFARKLLFPVSMVFCLMMSLSCKKVYTTNVITADSTAANPLTSFWFDPVKNPAYINDTLQLTIDSNTVSGRIPYYTSLTSLIPTFSGNMTSVTVNGVPQISGTTPQNFTTPVTYAVTGKTGLVVNYTVSVINFTGLPVIMITTTGSEPITSENDYIDGNISIDGAGIYPDFNGAMTIKGHGNSTWAYPKKPYHVKFSSKTAVFNYQANKDYILLANYLDVTMLRNEVSLYMGQLSDLAWTPHSNFAELFLNNVYEGTYEVTEEVDQSSTKVNITNNGYLVVIEPLSDVDSGDVYFNTATTGLLFDIKNPNVSPKDAQYNFIQNYLNQTESALFGPDFTDTTVGYRHYIDVPSFVDWYLINEITKNNDAAFYASCYMNMAPGAKLSMGPIWDFDIALGNVGYNNNNTPQGFWVNTCPWMARLFQDTFFVRQVQQRFLYFNTQVTNYLNNINSNSSMLRWSVVQNNDVWQTLYKTISIESNPAVWGSYNNEIIYLKDWLTTRMAWLQSAYAAMD
jgi:CotH kinase protein